MCQTSVYIAASTSTTWLRPSSHLDYYHLESEGEQQISAAAASSNDQQQGEGE